MRTATGAGRRARGWVCLTVLVVGGCQQGSVFCSSRPAEGRWEEGEEAQRRVAALTAEAGAARRTGRRDRALDLLKEAVGLCPTDGRAQHLLGLVYFERGDLYNAAVRLDLASRLLRDRFEPCYNLGRVLEAGGQYEQAIRSYERSLGRRLDHLETMENLARVRLKAGYRDQETLGLLDRCLDRERRPEWSCWLGTEAERLRGRLEREGRSVSFSSGSARGGPGAEERSSRATE